MGAGDFAGTAAPAAPAQARRQPGNGKQQDGKHRNGKEKAVSDRMGNWPQTLPALEATATGSMLSQPEPEPASLQKSYRNVVMISSSSMATICYEGMAKAKLAPAKLRTKHLPSLEIPMMTFWPSACNI